MSGKFNIAIVRKVRDMITGGQMNRRDGAMAQIIYDHYDDSGDPIQRDIEARVKELSSENAELQERIKALEDERGEKKTPTPDSDWLNLPERDDSG